MGRSRPLAALGGAVSGVLGAALVFTAVSMAASILDRSAKPVEALSGPLVAVSVAAAMLICAGVLVLAFTRNRDVLLLSGGATILVLASVLSLLSIGILVLPFALGAVFLVVRRSADRARLLPALVAGPVIAVALSVLVVVWVQPPLVECTEAGAVTTSRPWWSSGTSSGEGSSVMRAGGEEESTGTIDTPAGRYIFRCTAGELTQFRRFGSR